MPTHQFETDDPFGVARKLLAAGKAAREDRLETVRNGKVCLYGSIGWFADHKVEEGATISPRFTKWKPFTASTYRALTAKIAPEVG